MFKTLGHVAYPWNFVTTVVNHRQINYSTTVSFYRIETRTAKERAKYTITTSKYTIITMFCYNLEKPHEVLITRLSSRYYYYPGSLQVTAHTLTTWLREHVKLIRAVEGNRARQVRQTGNTLEQSLTFAFIQMWTEQLKNLPTYISR